VPLSATTVEEASLVGTLNARFIGIFSAGQHHVTHSAAWCPHRVPSGARFVTRCVCHAHTAGGRDDIFSVGDGHGRRSSIIASTRYPCAVLPRLYEWFR
jgi:hypothetical protein